MYVQFRVEEAKMEFYIIDSEFPTTRNKEKLEFYTFYSKYLGWSADNSSLKEYIRKTLFEGKTIISTEVGRGKELEKISNHH